MCKCPFAKVLLLVLVFSLNLNFTCEKDLHVSLFGFGGFAIPFCVPFFLACIDLALHYGTGCCLTQQIGLQQYLGSQNISTRTVLEMHLTS